MTGKITDCRFIVCAARLRCNAGNRNLIALHGGTIASIVVEIEVDMVFILTDNTAGKLAILQLQCVAGVIFQGDVSRCRLLTVQIGVGGIGDQLIAIAVHIEIAFRHFRILFVEVGLLLGLCTPTRRIGGTFHLYGYLFGDIVIQIYHNGDSTIATG